MGCSDHTLYGTRRFYGTWEEEGEDENDEEEDEEEEESTRNQQTRNSRQAPGDSA